LHINIQPIEKSDQREDGSVEVHSIFYTIQGEGPLTGHPAVFVRLAGCNLQCPACDTEYTSKRELMTPEEIVRRVAKLVQSPRLVVITGGEPFRQNISLLTLMLGDHGYSTQVETNGTLPPPSGMDLETMIVVSPKAGKVNLDTAGRANAWKYVLDHRSVDPDDGLPILALDHSAKPRVARPVQDFPVGAIYVQPMDAQDVMINYKNQQAVVKTCMRYGYTLQLQTHKLLNME
jgi:7-carboxy-7-deazaguanine synthase